VTTVDAVARRPAEAGWVVVLGQELRDLWWTGRALLFLLPFSVLLSVIAYLTATNQALNYLEQRETVNLTLQVAAGVGALLTLVAAADAVSGERERGTLEGLLLTPVSRTEIVVGKLLGSLSLWLASFAITIPYLWFLGRGIGITGDAITTGFVVGTCLALFLAPLGILVSTFAHSNRVSLSVSLLALLAVFAPTQLPASALKGGASDLLLRINPITAGLHYVGKIVVDGHAWTDDLSWLVAPVLAAVLVVIAAIFGGRHLGLGQAPG
jgi:ABC-2 type transport system permease protein